MLESAFFNSSEKGIAYLVNNQQQNGSFLSFSSPYANDFKKVISFKSTFSTALILQCLTKLPEKKVLIKTKHNAATFLLSQKSSLWSWNYWDRTSREAISLPYPDDLDDTFCALTALSFHKPSVITGKVLGYATQLLTALEIKEGGPYRTWLVNDDAADIWKDVDLGVNANIAYFLSLQGITLPNLTKLFDQAIKNKTFTTPYYPKPFSVLYFLARFIKGNERKEILRKILTELHPTTALDISLQIAALLYLHAPIKTVKEMMMELIALQKNSGSWDASAFYTGVNPKKDKTFYAGSNSLTTAFCLEAITLYRERTNRKRKPISQSRVTDMDDLYIRIINNVETRFSQLGSNLQTEAHVYLKQVLKNDKERQITLLPYIFYKALNLPEKDIPLRTAATLGAASVYGWIAYTIYDNFLDNEGLPSSLPLANICLREVTEIFNSTLSATTGFQEVFKEIMDKQEEVNTWEVNTCRFDTNRNFENIQIPDYQKYKVLADRSMGHSLGCIAILMSLGYKKDSTEVIGIRKFFTHYLIARQLNDDAHDWEKDLKMGHINSVGALLLKKSKKDLEKVFWYEVVDDVCDLIMSHAKKARESLAYISIMKNKKAFSSIIEKQERSVILTREEKKNALSFLSTFSVNH